MPNTKATTARTKTTAQAKTAPKAAPKAPVKAAAKPAVDKAAEREALSTRIAAERKTAHSVFTQLSESVSIPVKSLAAFKRTYKRDVTAHAIGRKPSPRQAAALYVALTASGGKLADNVAFPRKFEMRGASYAIENGALSDAIASGLAAYDSKAETVTIRNAAELSAQIKTTGFKL
jgi:hypothetical protein